MERETVQTTTATTDVSVKKNTDVATNYNEVYTGRVKWFNNRSGYGFIRVLSEVKKDEDIFVNHSAIQVENDQYRYLVQGEYIEFHLQKSNDLTHPYQAASVRGIGGGALMCETHFELKKNRFKTDKNTLV